NGELSLSGEWLTQTGLTGQPLAISVMAGKVIIQFQKNEHAFVIYSRRIQQ
ncbi:hypothetical protein DBO95_25325, partial [Yersinia pestis]